MQEIELSRKRWLIQCDDFFYFFLIGGNHPTLCLPTLLSVKNCPCSFFRRFWASFLRCFPEVASGTRPQLSGDATLPDFSILSMTLPLFWLLSLRVSAFGAFPQQLMTLGIPCEINLWLFFSVSRNAQYTSHHTVPPAQTKRINCTGLHCNFFPWLLFQVSYFEIYLDKIRDLLDGE